MWPATFDQRLSSWVALRRRAATFPVEEWLSEVNQWWHETPWVPYALHWDDRDTWPGPWDLLADGVFDSLGRGLGIMYTLAAAGFDDNYFTVLRETPTGYSIVDISHGLYILNYDPSSILNITPPECFTHEVTLAEIKQKLQ